MTRARTIPFALMVMASALLAGCGGSGGNTPGTVTADTPNGPVTVGAAGSEVIEPMSVFEKRRLIARISQDPHQIERLTVRERRELAAMAEAVKKHHGEE